MVFLPALVVVAAAGAPQLLAPSGMQLIGRFRTSGSAVDFDMPGCEIRAILQLTKASEVSLKLAQRHSPVPPGSGNTKNSGFEANAFVVWVDGQRLGAGGHNATFTTLKNQSEIPFLQSLGSMSAGSHTVRILKATEADWNGGSPAPNYVSFYGLQVGSGDGEQIAALAPPPPLPSRKLEFLGDSITAGFCNECQTPDINPGAHKQGFGATWDFQIGQILKAQIHTAAWSGLGMIKNCCGGNTTMPSIFSRTLATVNTDNTWRWNSW